jgi:hypothetical protein
MERMTEKIVNAWIRAINQKDIELLSRLMSWDHTFLVIGEKPVSGQDILKEGWCSFFTAYPDYKIYVDRKFVNFDEIVILGHTTGSHLDTELEKIPESCMWIARVIDHQIERWMICQTHKENLQLVNA